MKKLSCGFTLIEILVSMGVVAIIGVVLVAIFANTLRGSNKSQMLASIKQNGQAVLENMDKTIREADSVVCVTVSGKNLVLDTGGKDTGDKYTRYRFVPPGNTVPALGNCGNLTGSANGCIQQDNPVKEPPREVNDVLFLSDVNGICSDDDPLLSPVTLTNTNPQSGVSVESGSFSRSTAPGYKDTVGVTFVLKPGSGAPPILTGQIDPVTFQTTVQLRN